MSVKEISPFVVENGFNTCYMDSLFMALFYSPSNISLNMLDTDPTDPTFIYLQELIKTNFVEPVRKNHSISASTINEIRDYVFYNGWKSNIPEEIIEQQDVSEFYVFLANKFKMPKIEIKRTTITEAIPSTNDTGAIEKIPFIVLDLPENKEKKQDVITIKTLLNKWFNDNPIDVKRDVYNNDKNTILTETVKGLNIFKIVNVPGIVPLVINRFTNINSAKNESRVDIMQKIKLLNNEEYDNLRWSIHSAICHTGNTIKSGHYYALINHANKWLLFDDKSVPSMNTVSMSDETLINKIQSECVFVIYKFDDS